MLFFHLSSFSLVWYLYPAKVAIVVNVVLLFFLLLFVAQGFEIFNKLHIKEMDAVSGQFDNFAEVYQGMGDLDKGGNQN